MPFQVGMKVMVYEDPITCEKPEGLALITDKLGDHHFMVEFDGDDPGEEYERTIYDEETRCGLIAMRVLVDDCADARRQHIRREGGGPINEHPDGCYHCGGHDHLTVDCRTR